MADDFVVDERIAGDSMAIAQWPLCQVRLMDDARFPWLLLLPRRPGIEELSDLGDDDLALAMRETKRAAAALRRVAPCDKLNIAALGNVVRQLHIHVVARLVDDAAWPGPVWGHGRREPRRASETQALVARLQAALAAAQ